MKRILVIAGIAFLVSLAAGAGGRMALAPDPVPAGDETAAEGHDGPAAVEAGHGAAWHGPAASGGDGHAAGATDAGDRAADPQAAAAGEAPDGTLAVPEPGSAARNGSRQAPIEFREMGLILASMEPQEAGLFLSYLDDGRAAGLLRAMTVADAAAILSHVSEERGDRLRDLLLTELGESK